MEKIFSIIKFIILITMLIVLISYKSVQSAWLAGIFYILIDRLDKTSRKSSAKKFLMFLKMAFGLNQFWTWRFIFVTGLWIIVYIM